VTGVTALWCLELSGVKGRREGLLSQVEVLCKEGVLSIPATSVMGRGCRAISSP
jgi:hypothetical protein